MSIKLPESVPIPQADLMELLSGGIGQGISSALDQRAKLNQTLALQDRKYQNQSLLQQIKQQNTQKLEQDKAAMNFDKNFTAAAGSKGLGLDLSGMDAVERNKIFESGRKRIRAGEDPAQVLQDELINSSPELKKRVMKEQGLIPPEEQQQKNASLFGRLFSPEQGQLPIEKQKIPKTTGFMLPLEMDRTKLIKEFGQGTRESAIGSILGQQFSPEEYKELGGKNWKQVVGRKSGQFTGDAPLMAVGTYLGLMTGNPLFAYQGAMMMPAFVKSTADEIWKNVRDEDKFTLAKGGQSALKVAKDIAKASINATLLNKIPGATELLKKYPGFKAIIENNASKQLMNMATETGVLGTVNPMLDMRMPTFEDYADAFMTVSAIRLTQLPGKLGQRIQEDALRSGFSPKEFVDKVIEKMTAEKVSPEDVNANKGEAVQKFNRIVKDITKEGQSTQTQQVAKVGKEAPKAPIGTEQLEQKEKIEKKIVQKSAKSPVEEILKPEKTVQHRPETIAKEEARVADVQAKIDPVRKQLLDVSKEITDLEMQSRKLEKNDTAGKDKVQEKIDRAKYYQAELTDQIKGLEFEKEYNQKPKNKAELQKDALESIETLRDNIKNKVEIDPEKAAKDLETSRIRIEKSNEILKRGDLLSPEEIDYHTRLKKVYADTYKEIIKQNNDLIDELSAKKSAKAKQQVKELEQLNKILEQRLKRAEADIVIQRNKKAIERLAKGAKGAFYRKELGKLRQDVDVLQKSLFKQHRIKSGQELKTGKATKETLKEVSPKERIARSIQDLKDNPSEKTAKEAAEAQGMKYEDIKADAEKLVKDTSKDGETKTVKENKIKEFFKKANNKTIIGSAVYALNAALKTYTGEGLPQRALRKALGMGGFKILAFIPTLTITANYIIHKIHTFTDMQKANELKKIKDPFLRSKYINDLAKKGISPTRIRKIKKRAI